MFPDALKLLYQAQLKVYYQLYNIIELVNANAYYYCFREDVPGCPTKHKHNGWCLVCMLEWDKKLNITYLAKIKKFLLKLAVFAKEVYEQLEQISNYDRLIVELWDKNFSYRGRNFGKGTEREVFLKDTIDFKFNRVCE